MLFLILPLDKSHFITEIAADKGKKGLIITGDVFMDNSQKKNELKRIFHKAVCVDMEACAMPNV